MSDDLVEVGELQPNTKFWYEKTVHRVLGAPTGDDEFTRDGGGVVPCYKVATGQYVPLPFTTKVDLI